MGNICYYCCVCLLKLQMYNGVGLLTPRGTGTSGYVQTNQFNLRRQPPPAGSQHKPGDTKKPRAERKANEEILEHNRKRDIEVKLLELRETLEERGYGEEEIEKEIQCMLEEMTNSKEKSPEPTEADLATETHAIAARKKAQMEKLKDALGLGEVREGEAFNQELQEQKKAERQRLREEREEERKQNEKEEKKEQKKLKKEKERLEKELKREKRKIAKKKEALKLQKQQMREQEEQMKRQEQELQRLQKERQQEEEKQKKVDSERLLREQSQGEERRKNQRHEHERRQKSNGRRDSSRKNSPSPSLSQTPSNSNNSSGYNSSSDSEHNVQHQKISDRQDQKQQRRTDQIEEKPSHRNQSQQFCTEIQQQRRSRFDLKDPSVDKEHLDGQIGRINQLEIENYNLPPSNARNDESRRTEERDQIEEGNLSDRWQLEKNDEDDLIEQTNPFPYQINSGDVTNKQRVLNSQVYQGGQCIGDINKQENFGSRMYDRVQDQQSFFEDQQRGKFSVNEERKRKYEDQVDEDNKRMKYQ
eukprot:TRINITY_DN2426_c1_g1_i7.p1 TRINITY_DN2426_c1_g1~~TRINITY_DN2426_c1_g1_i7.p1  ORF type:complete len:531 (-),score=110.80 TRINITY_DN2426_c1_g1_i7:197-1789(-)